MAYGWVVEAIEKEKRCTGLLPYFKHDLRILPSRENMGIQGFQSWRLELHRIERISVVSNFCQLLVYDISSPCLARWPPFNALLSVHSSRSDTLQYQCIRSRQRPAITTSTSQSDVAQGMPLQKETFPMVIAALDCQCVTKGLSRHHLTICLLLYVGVTPDSCMARFCHALGHVGFRLAMCAPCIGRVACARASVRSIHRGLA
jgi:hypothetical protein